MSKNLIVILYFSLAGVGLLILGLVALLAPEQVAVVFQQIVQVLGLASTAAIAIYLLGTQGQAITAQGAAIEQVKAQTNGNLSAERDRANAAEERAHQLQLQLLSVVGNAPPAQTVKPD